VPAFSTPQSVVNAALEQIGSQSQITSLTDGTPSALAANVIYVPTVQLMLREIEPDFARTTVTLALSAATSPIPPWAFEYLYPAAAIRLRQVRPPGSGAGSLTDINDPQPIRAMVDFDMIASVATKVILTNQPNALAVITSSAVNEALWDAVFADAVVRRLANPLAMALAGRPDFAKEILMTSAQMASTAEALDDSGFRRGA
jgi:hypothetical protein